MKQLKISCNINLKFKTKPNPRETAAINNLLPDSIMEVDSSSLKQVAHLIGEQGVPFCPSTFIGSERKADNFEQLQLIALDFDNDNPAKRITPEEAIARAEQYHLSSVFAYDTMSSRPEHEKFRMAFLNDVPITDKEVAEVMIKALLTIFPEADSACKDVSRLFYGGKKLLHFNDTIPEVNMVNIITGMTKYMEDKYGKANYKRSITKFIQENHLAANTKGMPDVHIENVLPLTRKDAEVTGVIENDEKSPNPYIYKYSFGENSSNFYTITFNNDTSTSALRSSRDKKKHLPHRSSVLNEIREQCQLLREFETGEKQLHHMELFGLATNLVQVETGVKLFLDVVGQSPYSDKDPNSRDYWNHNIKNFICEYKPYSCDHYCPYCDKCTHGANILSALKVPYHDMVKVSDYEKQLFTIEEAIEDFVETFLKAINNNDTRWYIIKAQTALGKTETYIKYLIVSGKRVLIVVPTNKLKREVKERAAAVGVELVASPSLHELETEFSPGAWSKIQYMYDVGVDPVPYIRERADRHHKEYEEAFEKYIKQLDAFQMNSGNAITTHRRLLNLDVSGYDLVIVDEDIIFSSIITNRTEISVSKLKKLRAKFPKENPMRKKVNMLLNYIAKSAHEQTEEYLILPSVPHEKDEYDDISMDIGINVSAFADATRICYHAASKSTDEDTPSEYVSFLDKVEFNKNVKHIMVSATVDKRICEYCFGADNISFHECKTAPYMGHLKQYYKHSMSRAYIDKDPGILPEIQRLTKTEVTITFKKYNYGDLYFGNTAGCDYLKGKNINVIGTPHQPEYIYKEFAHHLGLNCSIDARITPNTKVQRNGYAFRFTTYDDEVLRTIQFYMIESELEQAVGRARLLRCDCTVYLFSNYPLCQVEMSEWL